MRRHDESLLWEYAARELDAEESALVAHHLGECVECREKLLEVREARALLDDARAPRPRLDWAKVDGGISQLVEARLAKQAKASRTGMRWAAGFAFAAALAAVLALSLNRPVPTPAPVTVAERTVVDEATGLSRLGEQPTTASAGEAVAAGEVLRTALTGRALLTLPDHSRVRLGGGTQLTLSRAAADEISLTLEQGRVAVRASHEQRRGFVVHAGGVAVRVVGTLFTVEQAGGGVEVAVAEGKVKVEPADGEPLFLEPGQRVRFDEGSSTPIRGGVTPSQVADFMELTAPPMVEAHGAERATPTEPAESGSASERPMLASADPRPAAAERSERAAPPREDVAAAARASGSDRPAGALPRLSAAESAARVNRPAANPGPRAAVAPGQVAVRPNWAASPTAPSRAPASAAAVSATETAAEPAPAMTPEPWPVASSVGAQTPTAAAPAVGPGAAARAPPTTVAAAPSLPSARVGGSSPPPRNALPTPSPIHVAASPRAGAPTSNLPQGAVAPAPTRATAATPQSPQVAARPRAGTATPNLTQGAVATSRAEPAQVAVLAQELAHPAPVAASAPEVAADPAMSPAPWPGPHHEPPAPAPSQLEVEAPPGDVEPAAPARAPEFSAWPATAPAKPKPAEPVAEDLESLFLLRAERALGRGGCERYLLGLQELASDPGRGDRAEQARVLRARCYDSRIRPDLSVIEYQRYLQTWPRGRFAEEARQSIAEGQ